MLDTRHTYRWFYLAIISLGLGGGFAFLVAMSRTPFGYKYFPADYMYHALAGHVVLAILLWLLSFTVVLWGIYFINPSTPMNKIKRFSHILSLSGALLVTLSVLTGNGSAVPNNYVPVIVDPVFFTGLSLFFAGFSINALGLLKDGIRHLRSSNILLNTFSASVLISIIMISAMIYSIIVHRVPDKPFIFYERLFWSPGHIQQILNGTLLIAVWYILLQKAGVEWRAWSFLRYANFSLIISALFIFLIQFSYDPLDPTSKAAAELTYAMGLGIPVFLHIANIVRKLKKGLKGIAFIALIMSMGIYVVGMAIAYSGFANDLRVPAHYHGAVTSLTLALMGLSYYLVKGFKKRVYGETIAKIQPVIYGLGMLLFILGLFISGAFGAPRKTYGVAFTSDPVVLTSLTIMGIGTLLAVTGGVIFVSYIAISILKEGKGYEHYNWNST